MIFGINDNSATRSSRARKSSQREVVGALVASRIVYAINWLNIGAIFYLMGPDLQGGISGLGTLTSSFYLGIGALQVPGGILAAKWGPKRVVILGILLSSFAVLGTSISGNIEQVAVLRFIVGSGMAFQFAPGVVIIATLLGGSTTTSESKSGISVGLFNSAFGVGGIFGLFGWTVLASFTGWRPSLLLSGILGALTGLVAIFLVPKDEGDVEFTLQRSELLKILKDRGLIILGVATLCLSVGNNLISSFLAYYLHVELGEPAAVAGGVATIIVVIPIFSSLWGARLYDRMKKSRMLMLGSCLGMVVALLLCAPPSLLAAAAASSVAGISFGVGLTTTFAAARDLNKARKEYDGLAISWVNAISLAGLFWPPLLFSYLAVSRGYPVAWLGEALVGFLLLIPLLFMAEGVGGGATK